MSRTLFHQTVTTRTGQVFDMDRVRADVRALWALGELHDIDVWLRSDGADRVRVVFELTEAPLIAAVRLRGDPVLGAVGSRAVLNLLPGQVATHAHLAHRARVLERAYRRAGYNTATVVAWARRARPGRADAIVVVSAGRRGLVRRVGFRGNRRIGGRDLYAAMDTRKGTVNTRGGILRRDLLARDLRRITGVYYDRGFIDVRVGPPRVRTDRRGLVDIELPIREGPRYRLGRVRVRGIPPRAASRHRRHLRSRAGAIFNRSVLAADIARVRNRIRRGGRPVTVEPVTRIDPKRQVVHIDLVVTARASP